jgi:hypothetical protein
MAAWGFALLVILVILLDPKFWNRLGAIYTIAMRALTGFIVELDPIAIIKGYLKDLEGSLLGMDTQLDALKGQEKRLSNEILSNNSEITRCLAKAQKAKEMMTKVDTASIEYIDLRGVVAIDGGQAARLKGSNDRLQEVLSKILNLRKILERMRAQADYVLKDMTLEVKVKEKEFNAVQKGHGAFKSAMKILQGNGLGKELYDESMEFMAQDLGNKIGEIERFMENSGSILTSMDVDSEMFADKGMKLLDEWNLKGDKLLITSPKEALKLGQGNGIPVTNASFVTPAVATTSRSKYIN